MNNLFNKPVPRTVADQDVQILKVSLADFDAAITMAEWFKQLDLEQFSLADLREALQPGSPRREALLALLQACIRLPGEGNEDSRPLTAQDFETMPAIALAEAAIEVMGVNADFFFRTKLKILEMTARLTSTGSRLSSSSSVPATTETGSVDTPSQS